MIVITFIKNFHSFRWSWLRQRTNTRLGTNRTLMSKQLSSEPPPMSNIQNIPNSQLGTNRTLMSQQLSSEAPANSSYCKLIHDTVSCEHIHSEVTGFSKTSLHRIRRKTLYYMYNIVFPCMMMSTLTVRTDEKIFPECCYPLYLEQTFIPYQLNFEEFLIHDYIYNLYSYIFIHL